MKNRTNGRAKHAFLAAAAVAVTAGAMPSQQLSAPPARATPSDLPLDSNLWLIEREWRAGAKPDDELRRDLEARSYVIDDSQRIHTEIVRPDGLDTPLAGLLARYGAVLDRQVPGRADVWVPVTRLTELARGLPEGNFLVPAPVLALDDVVGEGPGVVNSTGYATAGADGSGLTIAIIDGEFGGLSAARSNGDAPTLANSTLINLASGAFESGGAHGTGCVEAAFDHAPGAQWRLYRTDSSTDVATAIVDASFAGVDIVSMSVSFYNLGWADDTGTVSNAATAAAQNGMLFFTAAGNRAQAHHQAVFTDPDGDGWCELSGTSDETVDIDVESGGRVRLFLAWDTSGGTHDYDLYLYDSDLTTVLGSSTNSGNTFEAVSWTNPLGSSRTVHVGIYRDDGGAVEFELFDHNRDANWLEHTVAWSATTSPSNTSHPNVISVAAVDEADYGAANGANVIRSYSSHGPSNGGLLKPDLAGPTNTTGFTYSLGFGGTSCATPNAAGAAAAFWSSDPQLDASAVRHLLQEQALVYRDWGAGGNDTVYGWGGVRLVDHAPNTLWIDKDFGNTSNLRQFPFATLQAAHDSAASGGRLLAIGASSYPASAALAKPLSLGGVGAAKTFGD